MTICDVKVYVKILSVKINDLKNYKPAVWYSSTSIILESYISEIL